MIKNRRFSDAQIMGILIQAEKNAARRVTLTSGVLLGGYQIDSMGQKSFRPIQAQEYMRKTLHQ